MYNKDNKYNQEVQHSVENYCITLLSGETITILNITDEDICENFEDCITIDLNTATYDKRLYDAFKNKELIQCIVKHSKNVNVENAEIIKREFIYNKYFKIQNYVTTTNSVTSYSITFQTV